MGTVMAKDGKHLFVIDGRSKMVLTIDTATNAVAGSVGGRAAAVGASRSHRTARRSFTANGPSGDVSIIDVATNQVTKKVPVGRGPWGLRSVVASAP
jgi:YVTN family beta-propeller protein